MENIDKFMYPFNRKMKTKQKFINNFTKKFINKITLLQKLIF